MESTRTPITDNIAEVAEIAASLPDREEELLQASFATLAETLVFDRAVFLEVDGPALVVRAGAARHRAPVADVPGLASFLEGRECRVLDDASLEADLGRALGDANATPTATSTLLVSVAAGDVAMGLLVFSRTGGEPFDVAVLPVARLCGNLIALGLLATRQADSVEQYQAMLEERNRLLVEEVAAEADSCHALESCESRVMRRLVRMIKRVAVTDAPVLVTGETGTGKEIVARAIHAWSSRAEEPFLQLNCAALPENLVESELFGHKKGAFSGATEDRPGRFRAADGGTLLLDEVGELPPAIQAKLLRVLQEGQLEAVGSDRTVPVDVRIIAATNVDLERAVEDGRFREDLYYRLHVFPLRVPPLRERLDDLPTIVENVLERAARRTGRGPWTVAQKELRRMADYGWPGNVRELVNTLERARVLCPLGGELEVDLPRRKVRRKRRTAWVTLDENERAYLEQVLTATRGKVYGNDGAAALLDVPPTTLQSRLRRLGLAASDFRD